MKNLTDQNIAYLAAALAECLTRGLTIREIKELQALLCLVDNAIRAIVCMRFIE